MAAKAIPAHLRQQAVSNGEPDGSFQQRKHHGKSQSHVVSKSSTIGTFSAAE